MFLLKSNDHFFLKSIYQVLNSRSSYFLINDKDFFFETISIENQENFIIFESNNFRKKISKPFTIKSIFDTIYFIMTDVKIEINGATYIPIKQKIHLDKKSIILGNIHNLIFSSLLLYSKQGLLKSFLYKMIWPEDKNLQPNKLDTHLTNLKNLLFEKLKFHLEIKMVNGKMFLVIN